MHILILILSILIIITFFIFIKRNRNSNKKTIKPPSHYKPGYKLKVVTVIDGDTYMLRTPEDKVIKVRLIGIDTPESHKSEHKDIQFYGNEAKKYAITHLLKKDIKIEYDVQTVDDYNRHLVYIFLDNGTLWNEQLASNGFARVITYNPNIKYQARLQKAEQNARSKSLGLWTKK